MTLADELAGIFKKEIQIILDKEEAKPEFLVSEDYPNNEERARAGVQLAMVQVIKKLGLYSCIHRADAHGENTSAERVSLEASIKPEYLEEVGTKEWWNG